MKVILLDDVYKHGVAGEVVDVAPGYARNYLIPQRLAVKATPGLMRQYENLRRQAEVRRAERAKEFAEIAEQVRGTELYFAMKAGDKGQLYGSVTTTDIADQLNELMGLDIDRRRIGDKPLRELGKFEVPVRLDADLAPVVKVIIHPDDMAVEEFLAELAKAEAEEAREAELEAELEAQIEAEEAAEEAEEAVAEAAEVEGEAEAEAEEMPEEEA